MKQVLDKIIEYDTILLHGHIRPDPDCYGCQFFLKDIIKASFPEKNVYVVGDVCVSAEFLGKPDNVDDKLYKHSLAICVDCGNPKRLSDMRYTEAKEVIQIDHHPPETPYGNISLIDSSKPACGELILEVFEEFKDEYGLKMTKSGALAVYAAICSDTSDFRNSAVTSKTFYLVSKLMEYNPDLSLYYNARKDSIEKLKLKGYVLYNFSRTESKVVYIIFKKEDTARFNVSEPDISDTVDLFREFADTPCWFIAIETDDRIRIRLRSSKIDIHHLAMKYNGGGHAHRSGCHVYSWEELDMFMKDLDELIKKESKK